MPKKKTSKNAERSTKRVEARAPETSKALHTNEPDYKDR